MKKSLMIPALLLTGSIAAQAQVKKTTAKPAPSMSLADSASYSFGFKVAQGLKSDGVNTLNYALVAKAMEDVFKSSPSLLDDEQASQAIRKFLEQAHKAQFQAAIEEGETFLENNKKKSGVTTLPSGLQYEVITAGTGPKPTASDKVTVHYKGTLLNGKQFDSSYDRGEPIELNVNGVIQGWIEGLQLMPVGSKYRFFIPYNLAYGERGAGPDIPPYSTLVFEIELMKIGA